MIDPLSLSSLQITVYINQGFGGTATGFIINNNNQLYLVTNWHVVKGRNHDTGELNKYGNEPTHFEIKYARASKSLKLELYNEHGEKKWLEYPKYTTKYPNDLPIDVPDVDVILFPIERTDKFTILDWVGLSNKDIKIAPALPVSIIGFPFENSHITNNLPMWITGFVASEFSEKMQERPLVYINAAGYSGLSGSPVVIRFSGAYISTSGRTNLNTGYQTKFIGIYSGRVSTNRDLSDSNKDDLVICRVWKLAVIQQIINQKF